MYLRGGITRPVGSQIVSLVTSKREDSILMHTSTTLFYNMCGGYNIFIYFRDLYYIFLSGFLICTCRINPSLGLHLDTLVLLISESKSIVKAYFYIVIL